MFDLNWHIGNHKCRLCFRPLLGFLHIKAVFYSIPNLDFVNHFTHYWAIPYYDQFHRSLDLGFVYPILARPRIGLLLRRPGRRHLEEHALLEHPDHYKGPLTNHFLLAFHRNQMDWLIISCHHQWVQIH